MPLHVSQPSFQSLFTEMKVNGLVLACGTSFVVTGPSGRSFLVTARHNVTGRDQATGDPLCKRTSAVPDTLLVWHNKKGELGCFVPTSLPLYRDGLPAWIEHPTLGAQADVAAIPLLEQEGITLYPYKVDYLVHMEIEPARVRVEDVGYC